MPLPSSSNALIKAGLVLLFAATSTWAQDLQKPDDKSGSAKSNGALDEAKPESPAASPAQNQPRRAPRPIVLGEDDKPAFDDPPQ